MQLQSFKFPDDPITYIAPTWDDLQITAFQLSKKLLSQHLQFDRLVTLAKGGWPLSRSLVDYLGIAEVASVGVKFYQGVNARYPEPIVYQDLPIAVESERVLLFDDVADTGESLEFTKSYLERRGVAEVTTATLFFKPKSKVKPDVYGAVTDSWIIFPFEVVETITALSKRWSEQKVSESDRKTRFLELGITQEQIDFFSARVQN